MTDPPRTRLTVLVDVLVGAGIVVLTVIGVAAWAWLGR